MSASTYSKNNILNAALRGVTFPLPTFTYVSLHTANPGVTGANEVSTGDFPAYVRKKAEGVGAIGTGWTASTVGVSTNANQMVFPTFDGVADLDVSHFAIWDALSGGNCIAFAPLDQTRTLQSGDIMIFDISTLTATVS